MYFKLLKKIVGIFGFKIISKNLIKVEREIDNNNCLTLDKFLQSIFQKQIISGLIQIGANDGLRFDNLNKFIKQYKTKSILVEPIKEYFDQLKKNYIDCENIFFENLAISVNDQINYLYKVKTNDFSIEGKINFTYKDQEEFFYWIPKTKHKYDAEALFLIEDKIAILSKDRSNLFTDLYLIDKESNSKQVLESKITYDVNSLITGGDYNEELSLLALVSYNSKGSQYLILFENFKLENLAEKKFKKIKIPIERAQIEAIKIIDNKTFWITSEDEGIGNPYMYKLKVK